MATIAARENLADSVRRLVHQEPDNFRATGWWLYGMGLPDNVLEAVYNGNAKRLLNWTKPSI